MVTVVFAPVVAMETDPVVRLPPMVNGVVAVVPLMAVPLKTPPLTDANDVMPGKVTVPVVALPIVTFPEPVMPKVTVPEEELISKLFPVTPILLSPKFVLMASEPPLMFTDELVSLELLTGCTDIFYP
jgi:hypothetical protein